jgi:hypothetical protein
LDILGVAPGDREFAKLGVPFRPLFRIEEFL